VPKATAERVPVTILTGFLGSGKTTILNRALRSPDFHRTAVIVNEFGDVGIDHDLIASSNDSVLLLTNGCLCCAVRSDLVATLDELYQRRSAGTVQRFDRVIIETSGLAEPTPVVEVLLSEPSVNARYVLAGIVTTVDAVNGDATLNNHLESVQQIALADRILITKSDILGGMDDRSASLVERLRRINPDAATVIVHPESDIGRLFHFERSDNDTPWSRVACFDEAAHATTPHESSAHHDHRIQRFSIVRDYPWNTRTLELFIDALAQNAGAQMLRVKGIINVTEDPDRPAVVHGAQNLVHALDRLESWPSADRRTRIVFITLDAGEEEIAGMVEDIERISLRTRIARERVESR
jgi:G3E family GTPase